MRTGGRRIANALLLGGALFAALVIALVVVAGSFFEYYGTEDLPPRDGESVDAVEPGAPRPRRERVVRDSGPSWPSEAGDPAEVAPGTPPEPIQGRVETPGGDPVAGISVCVGGTWVATDDEGAFQLDTLGGSAPWEVLVLAPGYRLEKPVVVATRRSDSPLQLRLVDDRTVVVRGIISGDEGRPLSDATVRVRVYRAPGTTDAFTALARSHGNAAEVRTAFEPETTTLTDGTYELRVHAQARHFLVVAEADGHVSESSEPVHVVPGRDTYDASLRLRAERMLRGRVVDDETDLPVPGATVTTWLSAQGATGEDAVTTDGDGRYVIRDASRSNVYVFAHGYLRSDRTHPPGGDVLESRLVKAATISGRVVGTGGKPIHGAYVTAFAGRPDVEGLSKPRAIVTGEDGRFAFDTLWDAEWTISVLLTHDAKVNFVSTDREGVAAGSTGVLITVPRGRSIAGRVIGPDGEGVLLTHVSCEREGGGQERGDHAGAYTEDDGSFELRGLREGSYRVWTLSSTWRGRSYLPAEVLGVAAGSGDVELRVEAGLSIRGRVLDADGAPVTFRRVFAIDPDHVGLAYSSPKAGTTDIDGRFEISGVEQRAYRLQLKPVAPEWHRCYLEGADLVEPGPNELALRLSTGGEISGVVLDESGAPIADAAVQAAPMDHPSRVESNAVTDAKGRFVVRGLVKSRRYKLYGGEGTAQDVAPGTQDVRIR